MSLRGQVEEQRISFKYGAGGIRGPGPELLTPRNTPSPGKPVPCSLLASLCPPETLQEIPRAVSRPYTRAEQVGHGDRKERLEPHLQGTCSLTRVLILHAHTRHICSHRTHITLIMHTEHRCSHSSHLLTLHARSLTRTLITHPHNDHTHRTPIAHTFPCTLTTHIHSQLTLITRTQNTYSYTQH